jgi:hypothetical protein
VTLRGEEANVYFESMKQPQAEERAAALARGKADAEARGKEPFDLEKLETMDHTGKGVEPDDRQRARYEHMYYVEYPDVMTIEAFAKLVAERTDWGL